MGKTCVKVQNPKLHSWFCEHNVKICQHFFFLHPYSASDNWWNALSHCLEQWKIKTGNERREIGKKIFNTQPLMQWAGTAAAAAAMYTNPRKNKNNNKWRMVKLENKGENEKQVMVDSIFPRRSSLITCTQAAVAIAADSVAAVIMHTQ